MFLNFRTAIALIIFTMPLAAQAYELLAAVWSGNIKTVESLLAAGANVNETDAHGLTPLMYAALRDEYDIAITLINSGANINTVNAKDAFVTFVEGPDIIGRVTALMIAVIHENINIVNLLLEKGADINVSVKSDYTALSLAIATGNTNIIAQLLKHAPIVLGERGVKAIGEAVINRNELVVEKLLKRGVDANSIFTDHYMGLGLADSYNLVSGDSLLISAVKESFKYDKLPENNVSQLRHESDKIILHLLKNKADPNFQNMDGETALMFATTHGRTRAIELLLEHGADPNIQDNDGDTALISTISSCRTYDMKLLIVNGADLNIRNNKGYTPLNYAQRLYARGVGCAHIVAYLESIGAKHPTSKNIFEAARFGDLNKVQQFIREGADVNSIDEDEIPVLFLALDSGQIDVIEELLRAGADVNYSDDIGFTPLMVSVNQGRSDILKLFIKYGADIDAQNALGGTAASYAKDIGAMEDLEILRKAGAKIK